MSFLHLNKISVDRPDELSNVHIGEVQIKSHQQKQMEKLLRHAARYQYDSQRTHEQQLRAFQCIQSFKSQKDLQNLAKIEEGSDYASNNLQTAHDLSKTIKKNREMHIKDKIKGQQDLFRSTKFKKRKDVDVVLEPISISPLKKNAISTIKQTLQTDRHFPNSRSYSVNMIQPVHKRYQTQAPTDEHLQNQVTDRMNSITSLENLHNHHVDNTNLGKISQLVGGRIQHEELRAHAQSVELKAQASVTSLQSRPNENYSHIPILGMKDIKRAKPQITHFDQIERFPLTLNDKKTQTIGNPKNQLSRDFTIPSGMSVKGEQDRITRGLHDWQPYNYQPQKRLVHRSVVQDWVRGDMIQDMTINRNKWQKAHVLRQLGSQTGLKN